jgi:hypothetical protein
VRLRFQSGACARPLNFIVRLHLKVKPHPTEAAADRPGVLLGVSLIFLLIAILVAAIRFAPGKFQHGWGTVLDGIYLVTWGFMFLGAYYQSQSNFFLRAAVDVRALPSRE